MDCVNGHCKVPINNNFLQLFITLIFFLQLFFLTIFNIFFSNIFNNFLFFLLTRLIKRNFNKHHTNKNYQVLQWVWEKVECNSRHRPKEKSPAMVLSAPYVTVSWTGLLLFLYKMHAHFPYHILHTRQQKWANAQCYQK